MKKGRIFAAIIYFIFTFGIGIVFSLTLPGYFVVFTIPSEYITEVLEQGDYQSAMVLLGDSFNKEYVFQDSFEGGGIVLFETVMQYTPQGSQSEDDTDHAVD